MAWRKNFTSGTPHHRRACASLPIAALCCPTSLLKTISSGCTYFILVHCSWQLIGHIKIYQIVRKNWNPGLFQEHPRASRSHAYQLRHLRPGWKGRLLRDAPREAKGSSGAVPESVQQGGQTNLNDLECAWRLAHCIKPRMCMKTCLVPCRTGCWMERMLRGTYSEWSTEECLGSCHYGQPPRKAPKSFKGRHW